jgi:hypothetical protein
MVSKERVAVLELALGRLSWHLSKLRAGVRRYGSGARNVRLQARTLAAYARLYCELFPQCQEGA